MRDIVEDKLTMEMKTGSKTVFGVYTKAGELVSVYDIITSSIF